MLIFFLFVVFYFFCTQMDMVTELPAADQLTPAITAVYDFYHAFIMEAYGGLKKKSSAAAICLSADFLLTISSGFIDHNWTMMMNYTLLCKL